jgi:asparagine N-glycosylation enzyme membrane subunit Stt3
MLNEAMSSGPSAGLTWAYVIVGFLCTLVGLFGVIKMWKLQKVGFYLYVATSVISLVMGIVYSGFGMFSLILTALFIVLYGLNLKHLK